MSLDDTSSVFEERAENLSRAQLTDWSVLTRRDQSLLAKLKGPGAKLLSGPRGAGKSTLLKRAYYELLEDDKVLVAYVNYAKSLAIEPLFHRNANALVLFRQWVLRKIIVGLHEASQEGRANSDTSGQFFSLFNESSRLVSDLESGRTDRLPAPIPPSFLVELIERALAKTQRKRCVLLFDDAAHAFSPPQQREFFEIFRELRSRRISPKAAVYPGITSYAPTFHVGHEAELLQAWYSPQEPDFLPTMRKIVEHRLPEELRERFRGKPEYLDLLALASFGMPRGFLTMLSQLLEQDDDSPPTRKKVDNVITNHTHVVKRVFQSLSAKLPRYKHFIEIGGELQSHAVRFLQQYNRSHDPKAVVIGFAQPLDSELERILAFLEYAGVVREQGASSRGPGRSYKTYSVHYSIIIAENALSLGSSYSVPVLVAALSKVSVRVTATTQGPRLLGESYRDRCVIDLAPCQKCEAPRVSEEAKFCSSCGERLADVSVYEELLRRPVNQLPLTKNKIDGILSSTNLRTVQDILVDEENRALRKVRGIGPEWAKRIRNAAEEFVSV